jgi:hypothetical protein
MSDALLIVDVSRIAAGKVPAAEAAFRDLATFVEANEPRAIAYQVHVDAERSEVTVVQVHPDAASAELHMTIAGPRFAPFADLLTLQRIDVYGTPSAALLAQLRRKAELLGGAPLTVHPLHVGFARVDRWAAEAAAEEATATIEP